MVQVRSRRWLVEEVIEPEMSGQSYLVRLACADDDAQGQTLDVYWDFELDRLILEEESWSDLASRGFDPPDQFGAFLNTLRWNCVTATDPNLFQAPFRAGIKIDAYQMEPLRKALRLPRVNLFIADDTGLGKTIEAGLIARELLLRKKCKTIVVTAPPSVLDQWKSELEERFGLVFEILDRQYLGRIRRERGFGVNPWRTHSRFLVSHRLLVNPVYSDPMREWLGTMSPGSLLIIDEAHHAAPSSGGRYGIESKFTRAVRDLSSRFEHRLFLSATPHNGHSNSFSTLLELLDPYRFTRGVKVRKAALHEVMVRRLKEDLRTIQGGFPKRNVERIVIDNLPSDAPELELSRLLDEYRNARELRFKDKTRRVQVAAGLLLVGLQQRLLSSIEAFARSLKVHRASVTRQWEKTEENAVLKIAQSSQLEADMLINTPDIDDERACWPEEDLEAEEISQIETATLATEVGFPVNTDTEALWRHEQNLLDQMQVIAEKNRHLPDAKTLELIAWIRENLCPGLPPFGESQNIEPVKWNDRRVLIFTENRQGTKRYLKTILEQAIECTTQAEERIAVIDGLTSSTRRKEIQRRFNADPARDPLRILIATDAAREGLNFQAFCADLFHFDLPWNPGRIEQRNGRIDRKLQPAKEVRCHYFVLPQRIEDHVLEVLVRKTETIRKELGSLSRVIYDDIERKLVSDGIRHNEVQQLKLDIEKTDVDTERRRITEEELGAVCERRNELQQQIDRCQTLLKRSRKWVGYQPLPFRKALSSSLEMIGAEPLTETLNKDGQPVWTFPFLDRRSGTDPSWASTLDTLRVPRNHNQTLAEWRREASIRPVVFEDAGIMTEETVHLHLEQRVVQRLLARFRSQGFIHFDLSRACLMQATDSIPRVVLLGRLTLYGQGAERLHEEMVSVTARWIEPALRTSPLSAYAADAESKTINMLNEALVDEADYTLSTKVEHRLLEAAPGDKQELLPLLELRAEECAARAVDLLNARGFKEAHDLGVTLEQQRKRVLEKLELYDRKELKEARRLELEEEKLLQQTLFEEDSLHRAEALRQLDKARRELKESKKQLELNVRSWRLRLEQFERDIDLEPDRIREFYKVRVKRTEPVGLIYLWPEKG